MILRTKTVWIAQEITTFIIERGVTTTRPQQNTPQTLPTKEVDERALGPIRHKELLDLSYSELHLWHLKQLHNRENHYVYGNWEKNKEKPKSLDHGKNLCATTGKSTSLKMSCTCGTSRCNV